MKWKKFRIKTITDAEDIIISTLYDIEMCIRDRKRPSK